MSKKLTKEVQQQITRLLVSTEDTSLCVALDMIEETQATSLFEMELFLAYQFSGSKKNKNTILSLIKQTDNTKLQSIFSKRYHFKAAEYKKIKLYIYTIPEEAGFNESAFAFTIYKIAKEKAIDYLLEHGTTEQRKEVLKDLITNEAELVIKSDIITQLPEEITSFTKLKRLAVYCTRLKELPIFLTTMQHLESLDLQETPIKALPKEIGNFKNLESLNLSGTSLKELPKDIGNLKSLKTLDLTSCSLKKFPQEITLLENLEELIFAGKYYFGQYRSYPISKIPKDILALKKLRKLDLSHNEIEKFPDAFFQLEALVELNLHDNPIATFLGDLSTLPNLEKLNISSTYFITLPATFAYFKKLKELNMTYCHQSIEFDCSILAKIPSLEKIKISVREFDKFKQLSELTFLKQLNIIAPDDREMNKSKESIEAAKKRLPNCNITTTVKK